MTDRVEEAHRRYAIALREAHDLDALAKAKLELESALMAREQAKSRNLVEALGLCRSAFQKLSERVPQLATGNAVLIAAIDESLAEYRRTDG